MRLFSPSPRVGNPQVHESSFRAAAVLTFTGFLALSIACGGGSSSSTATNPGAATQSGGSGSGLSLSNSLPAAAVGTDYSATISVSGGSTPYTFSLASGELPAGLGLSSTSGTISGTPSTTGKANFAVSVIDGTGQSTQSSYQLSVSSTASSPNPPSSPTSNSANQGTALSALQHSGGWASYGQNGSHNFVDCSPSPCDGINFWMGQNIGNPSMSGEASGFSVGGSSPFSDALFNNHLIGPGSSQGLPDKNRSLVPSLHDFTYDVYFYGAFGASQALEFDINQFFSNEGYIFGHECRIAGGNEWDVWDNVNEKWVPTGISCHPKENSWNHLTIKVQRNSNNELVYQSITLNGQTGTLNWTFPHGSTPGWYGVTVNYQMDGNQNQDSYTVYLDNLTFSYQ